MSDPVYIATKKSGFSHPKCYLRHTNDCSTKIESEHYISRGLLDVIEKQNATIDVTGLAWLPKEQLKSISKAFLVAKILCATHNRALSPLDKEVGRFVEAIGAIDLAFQSEPAKALDITIDGSHIERWILKMAFGLVVSKQIGHNAEVPYSLKPECMKLLCLPEARWPKDWGLYMANPSGKIFHSSSFEVVPRADTKTGLLLALDIKFNGFAMHFLMGRPGVKDAFGVQRPSVLLFAKGEVVSRIQFTWANRKPGGQISLNHTGMYSGVAPGLDLPKVK